jgi:hypothetical protein
VPIYRTLAALSGSGPDLPPSTIFADISDAPDDSFIVRLDVETMENTLMNGARPFAKGTWHMFIRANVPAKPPMLIRRIDNKAFQASASSVTFGLVGASKEGGIDRYRVRYASIRPTARAEQVNCDVVELLGIFHKTLGA